MRPEEIAPNPKSKKPALKWENFLWKKSKIDLPAEVAKDGRRRFVPICDTAMAWLAPWRHSKGRVVPNKRMDRRTGKWAEDAKLDCWRNDALRHSYASYRLAKTQDIAALSLEMGNSVKMIHDHYLDLKHDDESDAWFELTPEKVGIVVLPDNVVQFA